MHRMMVAALLAASVTGAAMADPVDISKGFGGSKTVSLDLGDKRVNWTNARWAVLNLDKPADFSAASGLKLKVSTQSPRGDAGVYLAVKEADGTWYYVPWATNLTKGINEGVVKFSDFATADYTSPPGGGHVDENGKLDAQNITAIAVGVINPLGIGKVEFTVESLETVPLAKNESTPTVIGVTGKFMEVNGTEFIPAGVFGQFVLRTIPDANNKLRLAQDRKIGGAGEVQFGGGTVNMFINTWGDRSAVSPRVNNPNWKTDLDKAARSAAQKAKDAGKPLYVEWWNEPYLNWSNKNRLTYRPNLFDETNKTEGGEVKLKDGTAVPHLKWTQDFDKPAFNWATPRYTRTADGVERDNWRRGKDEKGQMYSDFFVPPSWSAKNSKYNVSHHPPKDVKDGDTYTVQVKSGKKGEEKVTEVTLTAFTPWYIHDETQFTFWSAKGAAIFYNDPLVVVGQALKEVNPDAKLIAGWGFRPSEDHWAGFELAYKPTIDLSIQYIDGICDHDYGGSPVKMPASYEVMTAYGMSKYNKWLYAYNTETAMSFDSQAVAVSENSTPQAQADRLQMAWAARKLTHMLTFSADKARAQSWFGYGGGFVTEGGEGNALLMLKNLRGRLVQVENPDPHIYIVASVDGTDPANPRPADMGDKKELVVALLNDHVDARNITLTIAAPEGTTFKSLTVRTPDLTDAKASPKIAEKTKAVSGKSYTFSAPLESRLLTTLSFELEGTPAAKAQVSRKQFFGNEILQEVTAAKPIKQTVKIDAAQLQGAKRAWVQFVAERLADAEGTVTINGKKYTLPAAVTPENTAYVRVLPIDLADVKAVNELTFEVTNDAHAGYLLAMNSIFVEK